MAKILAVALLVLFLITGTTGHDVVLRWQQLPTLPDTPGLASPFAGVSNGVLLLAGGANFPEAPPWKGGQKVWHDTVYGLVDGQWRIVGRLPEPCAYGVSFQTRDGIICAGGSDAAKHFSDVFLLRWRADKLEVESLPSLPRPVANACGTMVGDIVCLAGGTDSPTSTTALSTVYSLDTNASPQNWQTFPACPGPGRVLSVAAAHHHSFFLFSGAALSEGPDGKPVRTYLKDAWEFDTEKKIWTQLQGLPAAVVAAPSPAQVTQTEQILVLGGDDGSRVGFQPPENHPGFARHALIYDLRDEFWVRGPELQVSRVTVPIVAWNGAFVMPSGEERPGVRSPQVWEVSARSVPR